MAKLALTLMIGLFFGALFSCSATNDVLPGVQGANNNKNQNGQFYSADGKYGAGTLFGDGQDGDFWDGGEEDSNFVYPIYFYKGRGTLTHREGSNVLAQEMEGKVDKLSFNFHTPVYQAVGGDHRGRVNEQLQEKVYPNSGDAAGDRPTKEELRALESGGQFQWAKFFIYAKNIRNTKSGEQWTFSGPALPPVTTVPAGAQRYAIFDQQSQLSYRVQVSGSHSFTLLTTVNRENVTSDTLDIVVTNQILEDQNCNLYTPFALPFQVRYTVDTTQKVVIAIQDVNKYRDDDKNRCYSSSVTMNLCKADKNGEVTDYNGGCY